MRTIAEESKERINFILNELPFKCKGEFLLPEEDCLSNSSVEIFKAAVRDVKPYLDNEGVAFSQLRQNYIEATAKQGNPKTATTSLRSCMLDTAMFGVTVANYSTNDRAFRSSLSDFSKLTKSIGADLRVVKLLASPQAALLDKEVAASFLKGLGQKTKAGLSNYVSSNSPRLKHLSDHSAIQSQWEVDEGVQYDLQLQGNRHPPSEPPAIIKSTPSL